MEYSVADFIRNGVFSSVRSHLSMLIEAGVPLPAVAKFAGELQECIHRALHQATQSATIQMTGLPKQPPVFGQSLTDLLNGEDDEQPPQPPQGGPSPEGPPQDKNPFA